MYLPPLALSIMPWRITLPVNIFRLLSLITRDFSALCEIQWVIKFHFSTEKINHVDKVMDIAVTPGASFG